MGIANVRRWQWVLLSLVLGFVAAEVQRALPRPLNTYGAELSDQKTFEAAIVREYQGQRLFRGLVVYPVEVDEGGTRTLKHFVAGEYFDGKPRRVGGRWVAKWEPYCFVAPIPFKPMTDGEPLDSERRARAGIVDSSIKVAARERANAAGERVPDDAAAPASGPAAAVTTQPSALPQTTVVNYLGRMSREQGVRYSYAWWLHPRLQSACWLGGSFVLIGLLWPTLVNLLTFGTFTRPADPGPGLREMLRGLRRRPAAAAVSAPAARDLSDVEQYDAALEASLAADGAGSSPEESPATIGADVPPVLKPPGLMPQGQAAVAAGPDVEHHYEAKQDDFYPTEKKPAEVHRGGNGNKH